MESTEKNRRLLKVPLVSTGEKRGGRGTAQGHKGHHLPLPLKVKNMSLFVHVLSVPL